MRRAVVDTNVWVSALINPRGAPARVRHGFAAGRFTLLVSEPLLAELEEVLTRPRIRRRYPIAAEDADELLDLLRSQADLVAVQGTIELCRDPDDNLVIETALAGWADTLVTRDDDLKGEPELARVLRALGITVLSVRQFLAALEAEEQEGPAR